MIKLSILKSTVAFVLYWFLLITLAAMMLVVFMHSNPSIKSKIDGIILKKTTPHMGLSPYLIVIEDAHQFDLKARSVAELVSSGNLNQIPKQILPIASLIQLTPTGLIISNMGEDECRRASDYAVQQEDQGVEGAQCIHVDKTKDYAVVFRDRPVPLAMKGWWTWHAIREQRSGADRIKLTSDTVLSQRCDGVIVSKGGEIEINKTMDFCLPAFEGEEIKETHLGPFYSSESRASMVIHAGGGQYTLAVKF